MKLLERSTRAVIRHSGGPFWDWRLSESGLSLNAFVAAETAAVLPPSAESAGQPQEPALVEQSAATNR